MHFKHCCEPMARASTFDCATCAGEFECPDSVITFRPDTSYWGLIIHDGGTSSIQIAHCPWCGKQLPKSNTR